MNKRKLSTNFFYILCLSAAVISSCLIITILGYITIQAIPALSLNYFLYPESASGRIGSYIGNALVGTIILSLSATLLATPFALGTAIYLTKYAKDNSFTRFFRFILEVLSGTPSIVVGIFAFLFLVVYMKQVTGGFSLIAGSIGLAILILPVIERGAEEAITTVSQELEEGSYALGGTKWQTIRLIVIPTAFSGIITGVILGIGRAAEESAVVLLTAGYTQFFPEFAIKPNQNLLFGMKVYPMQDLVATLPIAVYNAYEQSHIVPRSNAFAAAFILIIIVLFINLAARSIFIIVPNVRKFGGNLVKSAIRINNRRELNPSKRAINYTTEDVNSQNALEPPWRRTLTQPIQPATSSISIESVENTHLLSPSNPASDMSWDGRVLPDDIQDQIAAADLPSKSVTGYQPSGTPGLEVSDLFENQPSLLTGLPVREAGTRESFTVADGDNGLLSEELLTEDLSVTSDDLMEEQPLHHDARPLAPFIENWQNMVGNKQENSHV